jgi:hypothetical protein
VHEQRLSLRLGAEQGGGLRPLRPADRLGECGEPSGCLNDAPCTPFTSHGASIRQPFGAGARAHCEFVVLKEDHRQRPPAGMSNMQELAWRKRHAHDHHRQALGGPSTAAMAEVKVARQPPPGQTADYQMVAGMQQQQMLLSAMLRNQQAEAQTELAALVSETVAAAPLRLTKTPRPLN